MPYLPPRPRRPEEEVILAGLHAQMRGLPPPPSPAGIPADARAQNQQTAAVQASQLPPDFQSGATDLPPPPRPPAPVPNAAPTSARTPPFIPGGEYHDLAPHPTARGQHDELISNPPQPGKPSWLQRLGAAAYGGAAGWLNSSPSAIRRGGYIPPAVTANTIRNILYPNYDRRRSEWEDQVAASREQMGLERAERQLQLSEEEAKRDKSLYDLRTQTELTKQAQLQRPGTPKESTYDKVGGTLQAKYDFGIKLGMPEEDAQRFATNENNPKLTSMKFENKKTGDVTVVWHDAEGQQVDDPVVYRGVAEQREAKSPPALTPEGLNFVVGALQGGATPASVMGRAAGPRITTANEIGRRQAAGDDINLPAAQAGYGADKTSLAALQRQRDNLHAFEQTARKNIDVFKAQLQGLIDTGSPLLNLPLREASQQAVGSEQVAAFRTARLVVTNEIARIVTQMGNAGVLTNEARNEVSSLIPEEATVNQILRVLDVLDRDMKNRIESMDEEITGIQGRISTRGTQSPAQAELGPPSVAGPQLPPASQQGGASFRKKSGARAGEVFTMTPEEAARARNEPERWEELQ